jgi:hypothetical protein
MGNTEQTNKRLGTASKKTGNMYSQREMGNSSLMENWEQPSSNWVQPTPRDNRQELWRPNPSAFIYGYQIEVIPDMLTAQWQSGIMPDCQPPELLKLPLLGTTITNQM